MADDLQTSPQSESEDSKRLSRIRLALICSLLLFASAINYLDRQTLASASVRIVADFGLDMEQYGDIEAAFGYGFVIGSILFGILADVVSIWILYPIVLISWSIATAATVYAGGYQDLLWLRLALGIFEAGHWPCGIRVVRALTQARGRTMGNGLLQSGTSIGAVVAPLTMAAVIQATGDWRPAFAMVGTVGFLWVIAWFLCVRPSDLPLQRGAKNESDASWRLLLQRRFIVVLVIVCLINTTWQVLRAWLQLFLEVGRGYTEQQAWYFNSAWFAATDVGCLGVGVAVLWLYGRGLTMVRARQYMFTLCAAMCLTMLAIPWLPKGPALLLVLLVGGAGALGLFPLYHAFTQDISGRHQGKITGIAGVTAWFLVPPAQKAFGRIVDVTGSYDLGLAAGACLPVVAAFILWIFWGNSDEQQEPSPTIVPEPRTVPTIKPRPI